MVSNGKYGFYSQLYNIEEGKEFIKGEFQSRIEGLQLAEREKAVADFKNLLDENKEKLKGLMWGDARIMLKSEIRFKGLRSSKLREKLFEEFLLKQ